VRTYVVDKVHQEPAAHRREQARPVVAHDHTERAHVISRAAFADASGTRAAERTHAPPQHVRGERKHRRERQAVRPLRARPVIRRAATTTLEGEQQNDQDHLVEELAPALHEERQLNAPPAVEPALGALSGLERARTHHGELAARADAVHEERDRVAAVHTSARWRCARRSEVDARDPALE
jgi:hypothetical protein